MSEGSSILRETGCRLKNQLPHCIRLRADDFSVKARRKGAGVSCIRQARDDGVPRVRLGAATQNQPKRTGALSSYNFSKMAFMPR